MDMISADKAVRSCARNIVITSNLSPGDGVIVSGGAHAQMLLEEIALECYKKGATPTIVVSSDSYKERMYKETSASNLAREPKQLIGLLKASDMIIVVDELDDPAVASRYPRDKIKAREKSMFQIQKLLSHPTKGKKWLFAGWPTRAAARHSHVSYSELREIIVGGIAAPPNQLLRIGKQVDKRFRDASWAHVWDDKGTDFEVKIEGRRRYIDDGVISKMDFDTGDRGANLPAGELFCAPCETVGSGTLYCPITRDRYSEKILKDVHLEFRDGKLQLDSVTASKNREVLISSFKQCLANDKEKYNPVRTLNLAELGIGFNPRIKRAIGYILTDEKVTGTVHLAFGSNFGYGGNSRSWMHWDFVSAPGVNLEVERVDGKMVRVMEKGKFV